MIRWRGTKSTSMMELLVRYGIPSMPGICGTMARPPTLMNIRSAVSLSEPTLTSFGDSKRPCPLYTVQLVIPLSQFSTPVLDSPEIGCAANHVSRIRACDHSLRRYTAGVHTRAAEQFALNDRNFHSRPCQALRQERASLTGSDDNHI